MPGVSDTLTRPIGNLNNRDYTDPDMAEWMQRWLVGKTFEDRSLIENPSFSGGGGSLGGAGGGGAATGASSGIQNLPTGAAATGSSAGTASWPGLTGVGTTNLGGGALGASAGTGAGAAGGGFWSNLMSGGNTNWWDLAAKGLGAAYGIYDAGQQRKALEGAGDFSRNEEPWGPSVPNRTFGLDEAMQLYGQIAAQNQPGGRPGGGGGGGGAQSPGIAQDAAQALWERAQAGHPLYSPANETSGALLSGSNPFRQGAADRFASMGEFGTNPYLDVAGARAANYQNPVLNEIISSLMSGGSPTAGAGGGFFAGGGGGGGGVSADLIGAADYIKQMLDAQYGENPAMQGVVDDITRRVTEGYRESAVPGITSEWQGSGRYGGGLYGNAQAQAAGEFTDALAGNISQVQYQDFSDWNNRRMQALGLGAGMDESALDRAAQENASRRAAGASAASTAAQRELARDRMLLDAAGMFGGEQQFGLSSLFNAANMLQGAQQFGAGGLLDAGGQLDATRLSALGLMPQTTGMDLRDLGAAFGAGADLDRLALERSALGSNNAYRNWQMNRADQMMPFDILGRFADLTNAFGGGFGSMSGTQPMAPGPSNLQGAISGAMLGSGLYGTFGPQQGQQG